MKRPTARRLAHVAARARWAVSEIGALARRGYAARREFQYLRYLLERAYRLKIPGLPPRDEILERLAALEPPCTARWEKVKAERKRTRQRPRNRKGANVDPYTEQTLTAAEQRKAAADPVRQKQREVAHVTAAALQAERDFLAEDARLRPRREAAQRTLNRLTAHLGPRVAPLSQLWQRFETHRAGGAVRFREIVHWIDGLTARELAQPQHPIHTVESRLRSRLCNIGALETMLADLEQKLAKCVAELPSAPAPPVLAVREPERAAALRVESEFTPQMPRLGPSLY